MQQNWIATFLIIGFVVYITLKGELSKYKAVLFGPVQGSNTPSVSTALNPTAPPPQGASQTLNSTGSMGGLL